MKIALEKWREIDGPFKIKDRVQMRLSKPTAVYAEKDEVEIQIGYGTEIDVQIAGDFQVSWEPVEGCRVFVYAPLPQTITSTGEVYTNMDRQTHESGSVLAVRKALRQMALQQQAFRAETRAAAMELKRQRDLMRDQRKEQQEQWRKNATETEDAEPVVDLETGEISEKADIQPKEKAKAE